MVKQTRITFTLDDVLQVRIICGTCQGEMARPLCQSSNMLPERCPNCLTEWWDAVSTPRAINATVEALKSLDRLQRVLAADDNPVSIRFEIDGDKE